MKISSWLWIASLIIGAVAASVLASSLGIATMMLILPGIVLLALSKLFFAQLLLTPAFFLWGDSKARRLASLLAVSLFPLGQYGIPALDIRSTNNEIERLKKGDFSRGFTGPVKSLKLSMGPSSNNKCKSMCLMLLYNREMEAVIEGDTLYRIEHRPSCPTPQIVAAMFSERSGTSTGSRTFLPAIQEKIASGECLIAEPSAQFTADATIAMSYRNNPDFNFKRLRASPIFGVRTIEAFHGDTAILHATEPDWYEPQSHVPHFKSEADILDLLRRHLGLKLQNVAASEKR